MDPQGFVPFGQVIESQAFQAYEVRVYEDTDCWTDTFEVLQNGERVYAQESGRRFWIGWYFDENGEQVIPIGQDITGNGIPNLVMVEWIGGAHCCTFFYIFELRPVFRRLGTVTVGDYEPRGVADLDGDGNWEFVVRDWAYAYYQGGGPWGPHFGPTAWVVLHYVDDGYHLVDHLMRKSAPPADDWETLAHTIRERPLETRENSWELGSFVLELIYSGHAELVEPFLDIVWSDDPAKRASYLQYLLGALSESLYWPEIKDLSAEWPWPED